MINCHLTQSKALTINHNHNKSSLTAMQTIISLHSKHQSFVHQTKRKRIKRQPTKLDINLVRHYASITSNINPLASFKRNVIDNSTPKDSRRYFDVTLNETQMILSHLNIQSRASTQQLLNQGNDACKTIKVFCLVSATDGHHSRHCCCSV